MDIQTIRQIVNPFMKKYGIMRASLFGSVTRGEMEKNSDVDLLVELPDTVHGFDYIDLKLSLAEDLQSALGRPVDIVEYRLIKKALQKYILPTMIHIYQYGKRS